jgi:NAD(P)-dependent dehydrogenase (short-subunit alcohol dehydrogenase family)
LAHQSGGHVARAILDIEPAGDLDLLHLFACWNGDANLMLDELVLLQLGPEGTGAAIVEIKRRLDAGELNALVNNAAISPKAEGGKRLSSIDTTIDVWNHIFQVNFFAPIML